MNSPQKSRELKYESLIGEMTLAEKAALMSGANFWNTKSIKRLGIPSIMLTDGPHGLRKQGGKADHLGLNKSLPATCFPTAATLANSWDVDLLKSVGKCLGKEAANEGVSVLLGPGLNIKRNPLCGRNFEYFSEDPYLSGKLAAAMIQGIQSEGVSACPKHFVANTQETYRMIIDEIVDKRALHELYLEGFRYAVQEGNPKTIMSSYNKINGVHANENQYLLQNVLTKDWEYDGLVVTDWGGNNNRVEGLIAGNALEMPSTNGMTDKDIVDAVNEGQIPESLLDKRVDTLLSLVYDTIPEKRRETDFTYEMHHQKAIEAACHSAVLLKNEGSVLPIKDKGKKIAIIGDFAKTPRYQGAGSSLIEPTKIDNFLDAAYQSQFNIAGYEKGYKRYGGKSIHLQKKACKLAEKVDIVLLFLGLDEGSEAEGVDRKHMKLADNQVELLEHIAQKNVDIVLILAGGSPVEMPFINKVKAILHGYLPGQGSGSALMKVISGEYNPSGKLAESYTLSYDDVVSSGYYPGRQLTAEHRESIYIGYRYYDTAKKEVLFPFGYGLSYTEFSYNDLKANEKEVSLIVTNSGNVYGEEIVQIYDKPLEREIFHAEKELKGFTKVRLDPRESKEVTIKLDDHTFSYYHAEENRWVVEKGAYEILACASSRDIRLKQEINIKGEKRSLPYKKGSLAVYEKCDLDTISSNDFEMLLGREMPASNWNTDKKLDREDIIEMAKHGGLFGQFVYLVMMFVRKLLKYLGKPIASNNVIFAMEMPFRSVARMSGGRINMEMLDGFIMIVNGNFWKGLIRLIRSRKK